MDYNELSRFDIAQHLGDLFADRTLTRKVDGTIEITARLPVYTPWIHSKWMGDTHCAFYHDICFKRFGFIHSRCQNCFKVVARLDTLEDMMTVKDIQKGMDHPSKVGVENRMHVNANYGAYWYNKGLEDGLNCLDKVREALKGITDNVFLKRACTEYEHAKGDSRTWKISDEQVKAEERLDKIFDITVPQVQSVDWEDGHTFVTFVEFAHSRGDMTYLKYTNGQPLYPAYVTYERNKDEKAQE